MNFSNYFNSQDFHPSMSFSGQETYPRINPTGFHPHQNPRKKRTKFIRIDGASTSAAGKPKCSKKPDPTAPKITRPCSECGKKFWSWKALFGHMRCHPERQWRGINPPPNFRRSDTAAAVSIDPEATASVVTEEDHEVASCLLLLANGSAAIATAAVSESPSVTNNVTGILESDSGGGGGAIGAENIRFECSSCKKVFGSHQALGGHRASHKNVKGCYAINKNFEIIDDQEEEGGSRGGGGCSGSGGGGRREYWMNTATHVDQSMDGTTGHKCSICLRVFSTGQALGGHKRCHWEKATEEAKETNCGLDLDLNLHLPDSVRVPIQAPLSARTLVPVLEDDVSSSAASFYASGVELDLRLGL